MSDSDDGAFESADEGETVAQGKEEPKKPTPQKKTATQKPTTDTKTKPGAAEQRGKHVKEKPADNTKSLKEDGAAAIDNKQKTPDVSKDQTAKKEPRRAAMATQETREKKVEGRDTARVVPKEGKVKTKKGRRTKGKEGSGMKMREGSEEKAKEGDEIKTEEGDEIKTEEAGGIKTKEADEIKTKGGNDMGVKEGSEIKTKEGDEIKTEEGDEIKTKEGDDIDTKESDAVKTKEASSIVRKEDSELVTKQGNEAVTDQGSKAITSESGETDTVECSGAVVETEGRDSENQTEAKTQPGGENRAESEHSEASPKATRRVERRPPPVTEQVPQKKSSGWGWGGWGSSILSTATQSVASLTSTVGEGFSTVMETVEMSLGAVSPEELAEMSARNRDGATELQELVRKGKDGPTDETMERTSTGNKQEKDGTPTDGSTVVTKQLDHTPTGDEKWEHEATSLGEEEPVGEEAKEKKEEEEEEDLSLTALLGEIGTAASDATKWGFIGFSNVRSAVKTTGMTFVTGGLDVLETIGKTTYDVLAEGDTGLKAILMKARDKPDLSKVLREAKDVAEVKAKENEEFEEARKAHFGAQFDEFQGLVQLEALESLSAECNTGVQTLLNTMPRLNLEDVKPQLLAIKEAFQVKDIDSDDDDEKEQDFGELVTEHASALGVNVSVEKLLQVEESIKTWLASYQESQDKRSIRQGKEIHQKAIQSLAEFTATTVAFFHRSGQLLLMDTTVPGTMYKKIAANLASLTRVSCTEVAILSSMFTQCLNTALASTENAAVVINPLITDVYLEASNSSTYIQDAFQLLLPIIQKAAIQVTVPRPHTLSNSS